MWLLGEGERNGRGLESDSSRGVTVWLGFAGDKSGLVFCFGFGRGREKSGGNNDSELGL